MNHSNLTSLLLILAFVPCRSQTPFNTDLNISRRTYEGIKGNVAQVIDSVPDTWVLYSFYNAKGDMIKFINQPLNPRFLNEADTALFFYNSQGYLRFAHYVVRDLKKTMEYDAEFLQRKSTQVQPGKPNYVFTDSLDTNKRFLLYEIEGGRYRFTYDSAGRLHTSRLSSYRYNQENLINSTRYFYNDKGQVAEWQKFKPNGFSQYGVYEYNTRGNVLKEVLFDADDTELQQTEFEYSYDDQGNWIVKTEKRSYPGQSDHNTITTVYRHLVYY